MEPERIKSGFYVVINQQMIKTSLITAFLSGVFLLSACDSNEENTPGKLIFHFEHFVDENEIQYDEMVYTNAAGNRCEISEIQWFISDVTLVTENGTEILLDKSKFAHYIDTDLPETQIWELSDEIPVGKYDAIKMTFGIKGEKNIPHSFPDPPESNMIWPYQMGGDNGGYHYMKLNGFWADANHERTPFNFHIGVGQEYDNEGSIIGFIQNWFETTLPKSAFEVVSGETKNIYLAMNVESWFDSPYIYDHAVYGGQIMNNQEAMGKIKDNGFDVFTVRFTNSTTD